MLTTGQATSETASPPGPSKFATFRQALNDHAGWVMSLFLIGLGFKLWLILGSNGQLPFWDQWNGEAADTFIPYFAHQLSFAELFRAHNEHRILWTRLFALALLLANGQWDAQLQMVGNAMLHCAVVSGLGLLLAGLMGKEKWPFIWLPLALILVLPYGWENALWAFQSQFYFLLLFTFLALWLLGASPPRSPRWRMGILAAVAALFTVGSGFVVAPAVAAIAMLEMAKHPRDWRKDVPTLVATAVITAAGLLLTVDIPDDHQYRAQSVRDFLVSVGNYLSWPTGLHPWLACFNLLPFLLLGWMYFRSPERRQPAEQMILGIGVWVILQSAGAAFARGVGGKPPVWRYMDATCFVFVVNCLSIILLLTRYRKSLRLCPLWAAVFMVWAVPCAMSFRSLSDNALHIAIPIWTARQNARLANARAFMATDDQQVFLTQDPVNITHPYVPFLVFLFRTPEIRRILPACIREPLKVAPHNPDDNAFVTNGCLLDPPDPPFERSLGSYSGRGPETRGKFESAPVGRSAFPYLEIPVAGDLGRPGLSLELVDLASGKITAVKPPQVPGRRWLNTHVRAPAGEFRVIASDESATGWFAFKEPREMAWLSYWTVCLLESWKCVLGCGFAFLLWPLAFRTRALFGSDRRSG